jgi:hypothetical protein
MRSFSHYVSGATHLHAKQCMQRINLRLASRNETCSSGGETRLLNKKTGLPGSISGSSDRVPNKAEIHSCLALHYRRQRAMQHAQHR